ncbi:hypothetical protein [Amycolatopsis suaedae]|uniref:Uncharacterized protein n=1 Tax=Amycolatopsis suaedae TaxID=2510978 RepID=A0A4V2EMB6_9PSEU|nr:hypothetical protein [Amycolatopsis suaedae]RZQ64495.1 hypothetical protein EWH70_06130 [Amycolatopsis suaedae]
MTQSDVDAALAAATRWLDEVPGVVGVGQGELAGTPTVDVLATDPETAAERLPGQLLGIPVRVLSSGGPFEAQ